jgi:pimeloyl-ACP methyl ester carboxylesterase/protein-S-isoprenylcysteine O-methyltransferase Ste14
MKRAFGITAYGLLVVCTIFLVLFISDAPIPFTINSNLFYKEKYIATPLLMNMGLLLLFGLQHSLMARPWFKKILGKCVPDSVERSLFVFVSALVIAALCLFWVPVTDPVVWKVSSRPLVYLLRLLMVAGVVLNISATFMIDHLALFGLRQSLARRGNAGKFRIPFAYKYVRHPIYTGFLIFFWATPLMTLGHFLFAVCMTLYIIVGMRMEERQLEREFREYRAYKRRVPALFPFVKKIEMLLARRWIRTITNTTAMLLLLFGLLWCASFTPDYPARLLQKKYALPASKFMTVDGTFVHYTDEGEGQAVILLHGSAASLHTWNTWASVLKERYRVIRIDLPGFGLSAEPGGDDYSMNFYTNFLKLFSEQLQLDSFSLAGNSLGGRIAWEFATAYPAFVKNLILVDAAGYNLPGDPPPPLGFKLASNPFIAPNMRWITFRSVYRSAVAECYADPNKLDDSTLQRYYELGIKERNRAAYIKRVNTTYVNNKETIRQIQCPVLVLWGQKDRIYPLSHARKFKEDIPHAELHLYENAGHIPMEENGVESAADALHFLRNN